MSGAGDCAACPGAVPRAHAKERSLLTAETPWGLWRPFVFLCADIHEHTKKQKGGTVWQVS